MRALVVLFFILFLHFFSVSQTAKHKIDSLLSANKKNTTDSAKINTLNRLSYYYNQSNLYDQAIRSAEEALQLSRDIQFRKGIADAQRNLATTYYYRGNYRQMLEYFKQSLPIRKELGNKKDIAGTFINIGVACWSLGDYTSAQESYLEALRILEEIQDKDGIATLEMNIGILNWSQEHYDDALKYYERALKANQELGDKKGIAHSYANMANVYHSLNDYQNALEYNTKALKLREELRDSNDIANSYINMANVLSSMKLSDKALEYEKRALFIKRRIGDKNGEALILSNMGFQFVEQNNIDKGLKFMFEALTLAKETEDLELIKNIYEEISTAYQKKNNPALALQYYREFVRAKDSLSSEESIQKITQAKLNYEFEKKLREEELIQQQKDALAREEVKRQGMIRNFFIGGFLLVAALALVIFRSYTQSKRTNKVIASQKKEVEFQKSVVEQKNKDITDSINYAQRIQEAVFTSSEIKKRLFPDSFVLFKPRDIVSGDFYWFAEKNGKRFVAAVDCTGHGVPGAFMSIIGNHLLNEIVMEKGIPRPSEILNALHKGVSSVLKQDNQKSQPDGMDIALLVFSDTGDSSHIEFAGANRPAYLVSSGILREIKGDKFSIGGTDIRKERNFTNHSLEFKKGDTIYISSDGYADQFGGSNGKKLMSKNFKELILANSNLLMPDQEKALEETFEKWKGSREQIDDVLVIGVRT